jgi:dolichol-phosphate mannosyltransferase
VFNEEDNIKAYLGRLQAVATALEKSCVSLEVVFVDDHSTDRGPEIIRGLLADSPLSSLKYVRLSRNSGSHTASTAGLRYCSGDAAVLIPVDLQDPPELIPRMLERHRSGADVVWAVREGRDGTAFGHKLGAWLYYALMRAVAIPQTPAQGADFVLMGRKVIDAYNTIPEKHTSLLAMVLWMGFRQTEISYVKQPRHSGKSKWSFSKKVKLFVDSVISFSYVPIRFCTCMGVLMALIGFLYAVSVVIGRLGGWVATGTGFAALMTVLLVGQGMIMLMLGVLGEYLWRTYDEARGRPRFLVEDYRISASLNVGGTQDRKETRAYLSNVPENQTYLADSTKSEGGHQANPVHQGAGTLDLPSEG